MSHNEYSFCTKRFWEVLSHYLYTVFICIEAQASIIYKSFSTRRLNESGVYLNPGINFLLFTCPG